VDAPTNTSLPSRRSVPINESVTTPAPSIRPAGSHVLPNATPQAYEVGYGKPPQKTRFKAGQSGNPRGRPKGSPNLATVFRAESEAKVAVTENGRTRLISKRAIVVKTIVNKAAKGDAKAAQTYLRLDRACS
jgi:hypothetical protein